MTNIQKLKTWVEEEKKKGLVDIKLFPSAKVIRNILGLASETVSTPEPEIDIEAAAGDLLALLNGSSESEDITNQEL